jgi:uncharacterized RDD family membrane protein YckC
MDWFYVEQGQQAGPVDDSQLEKLLRGGKIQLDTLVWREGMAEWAPYREAKGVASSAQGPELSISHGPAAEEAICVECGKFYPAANMIRHGNAHVCAACKPAFLQKLSEGAPTKSGALRWAPISTRFAAALLDGLILLVVNLGLGFMAGVGIATTAAGRPQAAIAVQGAVIAVQILIALGYEAFMIGKYGATLGKMACKIEVVTGTGGRVSYGRAAGRYFAKMLNNFTCLIGYIIAFFDDQKRALHDHICNTRVVLK